jgi:hypothetical protein
LLLHLGLTALLLQQRTLQPSADSARIELRLIEIKPPAPVAMAPTVRPPPSARISTTPSLAQTPSPLAITLPLAPQAEPLPSTAAASAPVAQAAPAPLNLTLPTAINRRSAPLSPAELANLDTRANSPRESAEDRMANALGAKGWTQIEGVQGGRMLRGPHGECVLIRPSMVDEIHDHPHAGLVTAKLSPCSDLKKGARVHKRPGS